MTNSKTYTALHIGDLHFWSIPLNPRAYLGKRVLGVGNLLVGGRARKFKLRYAPALARQLAETSSDAILFSGDFSTTALPAEFRAATFVFDKLLHQSARPVYSVPGNHDCYIRRELGGKTFASFLGNGFNPECAQSCTLLAGGEIALIRLNAATSNGLGSHGEIRPAQLALLDELSQTLGPETRAIWLMCHFPAEDPPDVLKHDRGPQLRGVEQLLASLSRLARPVLWLHGHHHYRWLYGSPTVKELTYLNAGAPLLRRKHQAIPDLGFHQIIQNENRAEIITHLRKPSGEWTQSLHRLPAPGEYIDLQKLD